MLLTVDPASATPLFQQIADGVRAEVIRGTLGAGSRLPAAKELAESLQLNLHTVLKAYQMLRDEGLLDLRRGRGAVLTAQAAVLGDVAADVPSLVARAKAAGIGAAALSALIKEEYSR
ncbi:GntR family transcriptional regulator [Herbiconiux sp. L3-i23]|uniref:GntR family transcriptional regulator n=1 Tax=Herbiconiux sp. L3-i23 TaxID=2905871 RepID=UPI00205E1696|nr:GntR family transcriptional regulator [Herbiconiux sp. L3-i23]BDI23171.1 GntR family transcriptional regulator [Herbiconiux sp. L3-i23]